MEGIASGKICKTDNRSPFTVLTRSTRPPMIINISAQLLIMQSLDQCRTYFENVDSSGNGNSSVQFPTVQIFRHFAPWPKNGANFGSSSRRKDLPSYRDAAFCLLAITDRHDIPCSARKFVSQSAVRVLCGQPKAYRRK